MSEQTGTLGRIVGWFVAELLVLNVAALWFLFWGSVIRLHYTQGDVVATAITTGLFVVPALVAVIWHLSRSLGADWAVGKELGEVTAA